MEEIVTHKKCSKCKEIKNKKDFRIRKYKQEKYILVSMCKQCEKDDNRKRLREARKRDPERFKGYAKEKYKKHKEKINAKNIYNYFKNIVSRKEKRKSYYEKNKEKAKKSATEWRRNNPQISSNRRARVRNAEGKYTKKEWFDLCERFGNVCLCCKEKKKLTADHIIPLVKNGTNYIENIQPLCRSCNSKKHTEIIDYRKEFLCAIG